MEFTATIDEVAAKLKAAKHRQRKCSLLIGAGCSVKAGIPTAQGFVDIIKERYPQQYNKARTKTYPDCMYQLSPGERKDLIAEYVDKATINWAHIGIAQLMANGYVDRVLTTNFDPLVMRACSLVNQFPAVYDLASSQLFKPEDIHDQAVFHLHGQRTGFVILNTKDECNKHAQLLDPVFQNAGEGRVWLVVGYSGENDPVFTQLARVPEFDHRLYWVGYLDDEPAAHLRESLLKEGKYAFYVRGFDADDFFTSLARELGCFPPSFCEKPFTHLEDCLKKIAPYPMPGQTADIDVTADARKMIDEARRQYEQAGRSATGTDGPVTSAKLTSLMMAGEYDKVIALGAPDGKLISEDAADAVSWAYTLQGNALLHQAKQKSGEDADALFALAGEKYRAALDIRPDMHEALCNWGLLLMDQADLREGEDADVLLADAEEKFLRAESILPGHGSYNLACASALRGNRDACRRWLERSRETGHLPSREHIAADVDLDSVCDTDWFKEFLASLD